MVLVVALDLPRGGVQGNCRGCEKVVARPLVTHPRPAIAGAPEGKVRLWIVITGDPHRTAAGLQLIAGGPTPAARLTRRWHGIRLPEGLSSFRIERRDRATDTELTARDANHHLAVGDGAEPGSCSTRARSPRPWRSTLPCPF